MSENCLSCHHPSHFGVCGYANTRTIKDDVGIFHKPSGKQWTLLESLCRCQDDKHKDCGQCGEPIAPHINSQGAVLRYWTAEYDELCRDCAVGVSDTNQEKQ